MNGEFQKLFDNNFYAKIADVIK